MGRLFGGQGAEVVVRLVELLVVRFGDRTELGQATDWNIGKVWFS